MRFIIFQFTPNQGLCQEEFFEVDGDFGDNLDE
jgi:hypothetical protein